MFIKPQPGAHNHSNSNQPTRPIHKVMKQIIDKDFKTILDRCIEAEKRHTIKGVVIDRVPYVITVFSEYVPLKEYAQYS